MTVKSDQTTSPEVTALIQKVARLELENRLLQRSLLVADHERHKAQEFAKQLLSARSSMMSAIQTTSREEVGKAVDSTAKMLQSIFATIPTQPHAPEAETE